MKERSATIIKRGPEFDDMRKLRENRDVKKWLGPLLNNAGWDLLEEDDLN